MVSPPAAGAALMMLVATAALAQSEPDRAKIQFADRSAHERIFVVDEGDLRYLRFGSAAGDDQSVISLTDREAVPVEYLRTAALGFVLCGGCQRLLMIGLGGGVFTGLARRLFPLMWIDAVELDPMVVQVARRYFGLRTDERFAIEITSGATFVPAATHSYDLILLDAYGAEDPPPELISQEFFRRVAAKLTADGVAILNLSVDEDIEQVVSERFTAVFDTTVCVRTLDECNLVLFGRRTPLPPQLVREAGRFDTRRRLGFDLAAAAARLRPTCP